MRNVLQTVVATILIGLGACWSNSLASTGDWPDSRQTGHEARAQFAAELIAGQPAKTTTTGLVFGLNIRRLYIFVTLRILRCFDGVLSRAYDRTSIHSPQDNGPLRNPMGVDDVPALDGSAREKNPLHLAL